MILTGTGRDGKPLERDDSAAPDLNDRQVRFVYDGICRALFREE